MIRTTLSFTALFGLLALACHLTFSPATQRPASEPSEGSAASEEVKEIIAPLDSPLREARREDSPLSHLREPAHLLPIGHSQPSGEIMLVEFDEELPGEAPAKSKEEGQDESQPVSEEKTATEDDAKSDSEEKSATEEKPATEEKTEEPSEEQKTDDQPMGPDDGKTPEAKEEKQDKELSPEMKLLREEIRECLSHYYIRPENVAARSPWACMHAMIAYGVDANLIVNNQRVNAIGYLNYNGNCNGQNLFYTRGGKLEARIGPGVQGHAGQYLAMLAQSRVKKTFPLKCDAEDFTVADLIEHEKLTCRPNTELTFKLISLTHYLQSDESWTSNDGQTWDIPRLIKEELNQKIVGAACGGTHRLMGFSYAVRKREQRGEVIEGQWLRAKKFLQAYHQYTFRLQNPDGSFSTEWFVGRADNGPPGRRLETTGHITEWLSYSLSDEELQKPEMVKSVRYLTKLLYDGRNDKWNIGPLGHGLHALATYDERVFGGEPGKRAEQLASYARPNVTER